jgi:hypothetical protein
MWNLHDSIEIYDYENITIIGNYITTDILGFYVKPSNRSAPTEVYILNNTQIGGSVSVQHTNGLAINGNKFIDTIPIHLINSTNTIVTNNILTNSTILNSNSVNTTIDGNMVLSEPGFEWLSNWGVSSVIIGENPPEISNIQINPSSPRDNETISIKADVHEETGLQYVRLHYRVNSGTWETIEMTPISEDNYEALIGPYGNTTTIQFYVSAGDASYEENIGEEDNSGEYYSIQVFVEKPKTESILTQIETTPEPTTDPQNQIPGYPVWSMVIGVALLLIHARLK